jgi:endonuclease/exonuclease/phosphatase family metal-dependent hydrolase
LLSVPHRINLGLMSITRIASSNCFWFQGRPFTPDVPAEPHPDVIRALAETYRQLAPDLLCIQEVQNREAFDLLSEILEMQGNWCPGSELRQYGGAALWKSGRLEADSGTALAPPQRVWQIIELQTSNGNLHVANCHLPSSRQLSEEAAAKERIRETGNVLEHDPAPDVILGDFNEQPGGDLGEFLTERGYLDAAVHTGNEHLGTTPKGRRGDQIWIASDLAKRVCGYGVVPEAKLRTNIAGKQHLSDHFPLWVDVEL